MINVETYDIEEKNEWEYGLEEVVHELNTQFPDIPNHDIRSMVENIFIEEKDLDEVKRYAQLALKFHYSHE